MAKAKKQWIFSNTKKEKFTLTEAEKKEVEKKFDPLIDEWLKTKIDQPNDNFNYKSNFYSKWYRSYFYLCCTYKSNRPNRIADSFEDKFTRFEYIGDGKYNIAYFRHTGQWHNVYYDKSLNESFEIVKNEIIFHPV